MDDNLGLLSALLTIVQQTLRAFFRSCGTAAEPGVYGVVSNIDQKCV